MFEFSYLKANSLSEAAAFVAAHPDAKLLAGGMTLLPTIKQRLAQPSHLVDVGRLPELGGIELKAGRLANGAAAPAHGVGTPRGGKERNSGVGDLSGRIREPPGGEVRH